METTMKIIIIALFLVVVLIIIGVAVTTRGKPAATSVVYAAPSATTGAVYVPPVIAPAGPSFALQDYVVYTTATSDIPGNPAVGTLDQCKTACGNNIACVGFSRQKSVGDAAPGQCWYKRDINGQVKTNGDATWHTYLKL